MTKRLNPFILARFGLTAVLWLLVLTQRSQLAGWLLIPTALTDVLDGWLARRNVQFADGRLDSLADKFLAFSVLIWLVLLHPELLTAYRGVLLLVGGLWGMTIGLGLFRLGRIAHFHLLTGKIGGVFQGIFVVVTLITGTLHLPLMVLAVLSLCIALLEESAILLLVDEIDDTNTRSIWSLRQR